MSVTRRVIKRAPWLALRPDQHCFLISFDSLNGLLTERLKVSKQRPSLHGTALRLPRPSWPRRSLHVLHALVKQAWKFPTPLLAVTDVVHLCLGVTALFYAGTRVNQASALEVNAQACGYVCTTAGTEASREDAWYTALSLGT